MDRLSAIGMDRLLCHLADFDHVWVLSIISFVWTVSRTTTLHTSTYIYLVSLACADYAISLLRFDNMILQNVAFIIFIFTLAISMGFVTLVSTEKYLAICHPIKHYILKG